MFLQAAGMASRTVEALIESGPGSERLEPRQDALWRFATRLTSSPASYEPADTRQLRAVLPDDGEVVEAANVVVGFNFANRVADALSVTCEVPDTLRRNTVAYRWTMRLMSLGMRWRMNFVNRQLPARTPEEVLEELAAITRRAGMGELPSFYHELRVRPHLLESHAAVCRSLLADSCFEHVTLLRVAYLVALLNADVEAVERVSGLLTSAGVCLAPIERIASGEVPNGDFHDREGKILSFASEVTRHADQISNDQVADLKRVGLSDRDILDLVLITAGHNATNRLARAFAHA